MRQRITEIESELARRRQPEATPGVLQERHLRSSETLHRGRKRAPRFRVEGSSSPGAGGPRNDAVGRAGVETLSEHGPGTSAAQ